MPDDQILSPDQLKKLLAGIDPAVLQQVMPLTGGDITMMFTDIVDSTKIKAEMGDEPFIDKVLRPHNELVRDRVLAHNGRELKTVGDAFLIGFAASSQAVECASEIQQRLTSSPIQAGAGPLKVRIGLHTGSPIVYRDPVSKLIDLSGKDVDKAARVEGLASGGQVLISEETKTVAKPKEVHDWGLWELRGLGRHRIFEVLWPGKIPERPVGHPWLTPIRFPTKFVGRETERTEIMDVILNHSLVTLRAMGGIGKTRLADEVAARVSQSFDDGIFIIELANTQNAEAAVVSEILARLNINPAGSPDEATAILTTLQNRRALLVLDNFEAVMSAATFVGRLLKGCPSVHILVTSQQLLGLGAEQQIEVQPMAITANQTGGTAESLADFDSFKLFRERARLKKANWDVGSAEVPLVAEILQLTDGLPLSIELAAAWADRIALAELRDGLKKKRAEFLKRSGPGLEEKRHASIQACIDWSFNLLKRQEKLLFPMLSVFVGGFFAEDVTEVCQTPNAPTLLNVLREHSLLMWEESLGKTRYRMLPTVREYAVAKLGVRRKQAEELLRRHVQHFLKILDRAAEQIQGKEQMAGITRITADVENIRAGMETAIRIRDYRTVVSYSLAFVTYLDMKAQFTELLLRAQQGLSAAKELKNNSPIAGCQIHLGNAYGQLPTGDQSENLKKAIACYEAALRVYTEQEFPVQWAMTQNNLGNAYAGLPTGEREVNLKKAIACYEAALRVYTEQEFPVQWAMTQNNLGNAYAGLPTGEREVNLKKAIACYEAALRVYTEQEFPVQWAMTQNNLGNAYRDLPTGDRAENIKKAIACYEAALRVRTEKDFPVDWAMTQNNLGNAYRDLPTGDRAENIKKAIACYEAALRVRTEKDFPIQWAMTQNNLGTAYQALPTGDRAENLQKAIDCYEAAIRGYEAAGLKEKTDRLRRLVASLKQQRL